MKAAITDGKGNVEVKDNIPIPDPEPYQCLCKMLACTTCTGTDQKLINGTVPWKENYPGILGHESVGRVIKTGAKVRYIREGDIFLRPTACYHKEKLANYYSLWGGFAEYGLVTDVKALKEDQPNVQPNGYTIYQQKIPSELQIPPVDATIMITLKEIASFVTSLKIGLGSSVAVLGSGTVGMSICYFAKLFGAYPVIIIGRRDAALEPAQKTGADFAINNIREDMFAQVRKFTAGTGVDYVIDAAGDSELLTASAQLLAPNGKMITYAIPSSNRQVIDLAKGPGRWELIFAGSNEPGAHQYLLDAVKWNFINLKNFYSHCLPFAQLAEGFRLIKKKEAFKVVFEF
ncbi:MAG: zinc-binding dehydrogenase [Kiritimatiellae bacterium]|nr:zinc-binding dehydrogenase [Verrucomicrobiota bacterium]MBU4366210.1 zinc-binding dehydrogenase [Verrucomicrobiota bacterium]MCG2660447.1 zinc-binding dehydrogenase [Kiritimatiellia bacterium]